ncbi:MAG: holo-ACP synthase [Desulfovibrionaceae bacterium]|nr:holo-ACP synthase [Desulfovibrionaceae bacterium]
MVFGIGCDITDIRRIRHALDRFGDKFISKILSKKEKNCLHGPKETFLAGRFAAKEAAAKALGTGFSQGIWMTDIEIVNADGGSPVLSFAGGALAFARSKGISKTFISISHEQNFAIAFVVLERDFS